ncbi:MAG: DNA ligase, partial [bacterium]|nr:DNA ligase [bacterium]
DCIVMVYYVGKGKRTAFGLGAFLVGLVGENDQVVTIAKIGTGLSDEQFRDLKKRCEVLVTPDKPLQYQVHKNLLPDAWVLLGIVAEIAADEITKSPVHSAGVALRFPRLIKLRDDKGWQEATTAAEVTAIAGY